MNAPTTSAANLPEALDGAQKTLELYKGMLDGFEEEVLNFGNFPSYYMGLVTPDGGMEHYDGKLRIMDKNGKTVAECVDPTTYSDFIGEAVEPWSFMKFPYFKAVGYPDGAYRVGPLARLNVASYAARRWQMKSSSNSRSSARTASSKAPSTTTTHG